MTRMTRVRCCVFAPLAFGWLRWFQNFVDDETRSTLNESMHIFA
jgi:hypothetical protein